MRRFILPVFIAILYSPLCDAQSRADMIPYRKGKLWGYCDSLKKVIVPPQYDSVDLFFPFTKSDALPELKAALITKNKKYGIIDSKGKVLVSCSYDKIFSFYSRWDKREILMRKGADYFSYSIDSKKTEPLAPSWSDTAEQEVLQEVMVDCAATSRNLVINKQNEKLTRVLRHAYKYEKDGYRYQWDTAYFEAEEIRQLPCSDNLLLKKGNTGWGIISFSKKEIIPSRYDSIYEMEREFVYAVKDKKNGWTIIGINLGLADPSMHTRTSRHPYQDVRKSLTNFGYVVKRNDKWGILEYDMQSDHLLDKVLYAEYRVIRDFKIVAVYDKTGKLQGYINFNGIKYWD